VVIDDGSHIGRHVQASFRVLFPAVLPGGWYVVEDLQTSYSNSHEGGPARTPGTAVDLIKGLVDRAQTDSGDRDVAELRLYDRIAFIRKAAV
jgi:cephalosporin hydroxylase